MHRPYLRLWRSWRTLSLLCVLASCYAWRSLARKCHALILSGGGDKGAYEAGAIKGLVESLDEAERAWKVVSGVSVGALNAMPSLHYKVGDEAEWASFLERTWMSIRKEYVYRNWPFGLPQGLLFKPSLYDSSPLQTHLHRIFADFEKKDRKLLITATDMTFATLKTWNETEPLSKLISAVSASAALPGIFPPLTIDGVAYNDGGILADLNIEAAIGRCLMDGGAKRERDVIIDIILCSPAHQPIRNVSNENTIRVLLRAEAIRNFNSAVRMLERATTTFPNASFRFLIYPNASFPGNSLDFDPEELRDMYAQGNRDAQDMVKRWRETRPEPKWPHWPFPRREDDEQPGLSKVFREAWQRAFQINPPGPPPHRHHRWFGQEATDEGQERRRNETTTTTLRYI
ncbi:unnamed protein product [Vitrella brassicaformis CCMP3155]|uniref:PNPLA domain-containing protein n=1 Tax=Vitrella brassicaformis (strain CCMP3155) TaxID=1169540 RepID=A0A0G4F9T9_VITBC|nr:unnamed protein product [Vitrella brassicaformis CCMP3155]|mmetsp:Transcript_20716/g.59111  ORF Transcript_20716/g.59111 Transcript_20716/m.59111 type:complete len:402 (+) Transcript_20716:137-1342(+)|eukprot:CEM09654.1 unnamed protein product [Vitrella brassicaformis CCMP3155]